VDAERLRLLSTFSNELSEPVVKASPVALEAALGALVDRYKAALRIHPAHVPELLGSVQKSFNDRYASLLNLDPGKSKFCQNAGLVTGLAPDGTPRPTAIPAVAAPLPAKVITPEERSTRLDRRLDEIESVLKAPHQPREVLRRILEIFGTELGFRHALVLVPDVARVNLEVQSAWGESSKGDRSGAVLPLGSIAAGDVFSSAYHAGREEIVPDAFDPKVMSRMPRIYYEMIGSAAFVVYPCGVKGAGGKLLFADTDVRLSYRARLARTPRTFSRDTRSSCAHGVRLRGRA
jgi:hypothetical protein